MTPVIAEQGAWLYPGRMVATFLRMLSLLALVMMPFGMTPAAASAPGPHGAMAGMESGHCDQLPSDDRDNAPSLSHCALACSMLTAAPTAIAAPVATPTVSPAIPAMLAFAAYHPEADTPPPKLA